MFTDITRKTKMKVTIKIIGITIANSVNACSSFEKTASKPNTTQIKTIIPVAMNNLFINKLYHYLRQPKL